VYQIIVDFCGPIEYACIANQYRDYWLLSDALNFVISMSLKFKIEIDFATLDNLTEEDANVLFELSCLVSNIKRRLLGIWIVFFPSLKNMKKKKSHICFL
jgi:hypothetical protein